MRILPQELLDISNNEYQNNGIMLYSLKMSRLTI